MKGVCRSGKCHDGLFKASCGHDGDCNGGRFCHEGVCSCSTASGDTQCKRVGQSCFPDDHDCETIPGLRKGMCRGDTNVYAQGGGVGAVRAGTCQGGGEGGKCDSDGDCFSNKCYSYVWPNPKKCSPVLFDFPACAPGCLVDNGGCPNGVPCHQVDRRFYRITVPGDQYNPPREWCYRASGYCYGCLEAVASGAPYNAYKSGLSRAETCHSYGY